MPPCHASLDRHRVDVRERLERSGLRRPEPGSISWTVNREVIVIAGWGRAILLLLAHPSIAAGVDEHSSFRLSLLTRARRLRSTVAAMQALTFGSTEAAIDAAAAINTIHDRVNGRAGGASYSAHDPHLLRWVHASLVESILLTYERLVGPLTTDERDEYCAEATIMEPLLGLPAGWLPRDSASLASYMRGIHESGALMVNDTSRRLARAVLFPSQWRVAWPVFRTLQSLTLGTLPPGIRAAYGFAWHARDERSLERWVRLLQSLRRRLPAFAREWPVARRGLNRISPTTQRMTTHMKAHLTLLLGLSAMLGGTPAYAQDKLAEVDKIFNWVAPGTPGCSVAAAQHGKPLVDRAYGLADLERDVPITTDSVFDAASIVKQFVAAATLVLAEEGRLSLTDDVRKHVPELPDYGHTITLDHLLTHTSGIRDWDGLMPLSNGKADALTLTLRQRGLNFAPGEEWSYSNSGYVLLKEIVARVSGMSFAEFARTRLFEPVGMKATQYVDDMRDVVKNRALAYDKAGSRWKLDMHLGNDRGGGGALLSTAADLIRWNEALSDATLGAAVSRKLQEPATLSNGRKLGYARGLYLDVNRAGSVIWHSGGSAGYRSALARFPESGLSVAVMCNSGEGADSRVAFVRRIFDIFVPASATVNTEPAPSTAPLERLDVKSKTGLFFNERTGQPLRVGADNGRLRVQGGPPLDAVAPDRFRNPRGTLGFMSNDEFEIRFLSPDAFELQSMEGSITRYRRAQPYAPTEAELKAFAGRYESGEIGGFFDLEAGAGGLIGRANDAAGPGLPLRPVDRDTFQIANVYIRFRRDARGKVVALDYSNPVVRNIPFTRVRERDDSRPERPEREE